MNFSSPTFSKVGMWGKGKGDLQGSRLLTLFHNVLILRIKVVVVIQGPIFQNISLI